MLQESERQKQAISNAFEQAGPDGVVRFTHPTTGLKIIAKRGEIDLYKNTLALRSTTVFDASKA